MDRIYFFLYGMFVAAIGFLIYIEKIDNAKDNTGTNLPIQPTVPKMPKRVHKNKVKRKNFRKEVSKSKKKKRKKTMKKNPYEGFVPYEAQPITDEPLIDQIDKATLMAWFRCNSCYTCKWRSEVIDKDPNHTIEDCSKWHEKFNIIDMVSYLGYSKEGRELDNTPRFVEVSDVKQ